jgi:hypothetical protein
MTIERNDWAVVAYDPDETMRHNDLVHWDRFYGSLEFGERAFADMQRKFPHAHTHLVSRVRSIWRERRYDGDNENDWTRPGGGQRNKQGGVVVGNVSLHRAAELSGLNRSRLKRAMRSNRLAAIKISGSYKIDRGELNRFCGEQRGGVERLPVRRNTLAHHVAAAVPCAE